MISAISSALSFGEPKHSLCEHPFNGMPRLLFGRRRTGRLTCAIPLRLFKADEQSHLSSPINLEARRVFQIQGLLVIVVEPKPGLLRVQD